MKGELISTLEHVIRRKEQVVLRASGYSMYPYILPGDRCVFRRAKDGIRVGQVGLVVNEQGIVYSHRLHRIEGRQDQLRYVFKGDANGYFDRPVERAQIIGVLEELTRESGAKLAENDRFRRMWSWAAIRASLVFKPFLLIARSKEKRQDDGAPEGWGKDGVGGTIGGQAKRDLRDH